MSEAAVSFHIDHVIGEIQKHLGDLIGTGFTHVHFDSYEAGTPSWTPKCGKNLPPGEVTTYAISSGTCRPQHWRKRRLNKILQDFDATIKDLYRDIYFTVINKKLKAAKP